MAPYINLGNDSMVKLPSSSDKSNTDCLQVIKTQGIFIIVGILTTSIVVDAQIMFQKPVSIREWTKRDVQNSQNYGCEHSKLVINMTATGTSIKIVTDAGDTLMETDDRNAECINEDIVFGFLTYIINANYLAHFPRIWIMKLIYENDIQTILLNERNQTIWRLRRSPLINFEKPKKLEMKCTNLKGNKILIEPDLDLNRHDGYNMTALVWGSLFGKTDLIKDLVEKGADVNSIGGLGITPLMAGSLSGECFIVEYLINHGANVNYHSENSGETPLHAAVVRGNLNCTRLLLDHGALVSVKDNESATPLWYATDKGYIDVIKELVRRGANINQGNKYKNAPIHIAVRNGNVELIDYLLESGADVNARGFFNTTPLIDAVFYASNEDTALKTVRHLLRYKVDLNAKNDSGKTALYRANVRGFNKIVELLKSHGAHE